VKRLSQGEVFIQIRSGTVQYRTAYHKIWLRCAWWEKGAFHANVCKPKVCWSFACDWCSPLHRMPSQHESGTAQGVAEFHSLHVFRPFLVVGINIARNPCHTPWELKVRRSKCGWSLVGGVQRPPCQRGKYRTGASDTNNAARKRQFKGEFS
jgi:hypothetical protein